MVWLVPSSQTNHSPANRDTALAGTAGQNVDGHAGRDMTDRGRGKRAAGNSEKEPVVHKKQWDVCTYGRFVTALSFAAALITIGVWVGVGLVVRKRCFGRGRFKQEFTITR